MYCPLILDILGNRKNYLFYLNAPENDFSDNSLRIMIVIGIPCYTYIICLFGDI